MPSPQVPDSFKRLIEKVTAQIAGRPLDAALQAELNDTIAPDSTLYKEIYAACQTAIADGWMCSREGGGIRYGRVIKPTDSPHSYSVDVVDMESLRGPHHAHPNGEIDLIMPLTPTATFDQHPAGWLVYGPGTAHHPTVTGGRALVLYLLPDGAIEFTRQI